MSYPTKECPICHQQITVNNFERHLKKCIRKKTSGVDKTILQKVSVKDGMCTCPICGKVFCEKGIATHIWRIHGFGKTHRTGVGIKGKPNARKGWTKETHPEIIEQNKKVQETMKKKKESGWRYVPHFSKDWLEKTAIRMAQHNPGGKCKWFEVNGIKVQGTYEKHFAEELCKKNILWIRPKETFSYIDYYTKKKRKYCPDFYIPSLDMYIELKGYWWGTDKEKMKSVYNNNPHLRGKLRILYQKKQITQFLSKL